MLFLCLNFPLLNLLSFKLFSYDTKIDYFF
uniref:Uncharacterized protein n=1 Tax=Myoviridae sp. ctNQV2 TaxID=2827683 RepID=A0A8S5RZM4_9CAUD|nr:MAG TPA: hypothetical protein [Myoviridae sp. ctNQV2]